jgi:hypothetical protein
MDAREKAKELVEEYKPIVNGYVGSSMLTNTEYPETILRNAKQCALIAAEEIINSIVITDLTTAENQFIYWYAVKREIIKL